ncbi:MAG TPA: OmpH family outer membrane protein [Thermodesulfobacteriota bacterium]|nr:OmpH family outer membrane protein [Thermodesulfobacteriota bacterium]
MPIYKKFIGILVLIIIGGLLTGRVYPADIKVGWVDTERAVNECNAGKEAKKALLQEVEKVQRLIAEKQKELQEMKGSLEKQGLMLTPEARAAREKELQTKLRDFQRWGEDVQNELKQKQIEMERNISSGLVKVVQEIGAKEGYTVILRRNENIVLFTSKSIDLTDLVIKAYDMEKK